MASKVGGAGRSSNGRKRIVVNLALQVLEAFEGKTRVFRFECVTGDGEHPTDRGTFHIGQKQQRYVSRTYSVPMNYAMFFTPDGKAVHQYHGPFPLGALRLARNHLGTWIGSHGCVRLSEDDARALFDWTPVGAQISVV